MFRPADNTANATFRLSVPPAALPAPLATRFDTPVVLGGTVAKTAEGAVALTNLAVESDALGVAGSATLDAGNLTAAFTGTAPDLGKFVTDATGTAAFKADVSGPLDALGVKAEVTSSGATLAGRSLSDIVINADATADPGNPQAAITATGTLDGEALTAKADVVSSEGKTRIPVLDFRIGENSLTGAFDLTSDFRPDGSLQFNIPDLGLLAAMAGQKASGDLTGTATIKSADGVTSLAAKATGTAISRGDLAITRPVVDLAIADLKSLAVTGNLSAEAIVQGENRIEALKLEFARQAGKTNFALDASLDNAPLTLDGAFAAADGRTEINLKSFSAAPRKIPLALAAPTTIAIENGTVALRQFAVSAFGGTITVDGSAGERLDLSAKLAGIDARLPLQEGEAHVTIPSGDLSLKGVMQSAAIDLTTTISEAALPQGRVQNAVLKAHSDAFDLSARSGTVDANIDAEATQFSNADLDRLIKGPLSIAAKLGVSPQTIRFEPARIEGARIAGTASGTFDLAGRSLDTTFDLSLQPAALPGPLSARFDAPIAIDGKLATGPEGAVKLTSLAVRSATVNADGTVAIEAGTLTAALTGTLPDLGKVLSDAKGEANFKADVSGPLAAPAVKAEVTSSGATLAGRTLSDLVLTADATADPANPQAKIKATGALGGEAINVNADVISKDGRTSLPALDIRIGENTLKGALAFTPDFLPDGAVTFDFPDIGLLAAMAGEKASGDIAGSAVISNAGGKTSVAVKASGSGVKRGDLSIVNPVADITIADLKALAIKGNLSVETAAQGANRLSGLKLDFAQEAGKTDVTLDATYDGAPLSLRGDIENAGGRTVVNLASLQRDTEENSP